jgi:hypothetical protein
MAGRPLGSFQRLEGGGHYARFLVPLGTDVEELGERVTQLLPISRYSRRAGPDGEPEWRFISLPGIFWSKDSKGGMWRAVFPFGGRIRDSFTYDSIAFVLWPLFMRTEREGRTSYHFLWPIFVRSTKEGLPTSWRVWPLYGVTFSEFYTRRFWLWPLFHRHHNEPAIMRGPDDVEDKWSLWPLFSYGRRRSYRAWSALWPFFGWASDPESGFWAWDGPWPLVRIQRPGKETDVATRTRFWPFYSYYNGDELESTWLPWPLVNWRTESYNNGRRDSTFVIPFWQRWDKVDVQGEPAASWRKLWPVYQEYWEPAGARLAFPALNPLWHLPVIDDHYAWIYELYSRSWDATRVRERVWGGLWKRESDPFERRTYLTGLWASRRYASDGEVVRETSLLLGLLRWRTRGGRFEGLLPPALPGPGFPQARSREPLPEAP